jgi:hypothetical protein
MPKFAPWPRRRFAHLQPNGAFFSLTVDFKPVMRRVHGIAFIFPAQRKYCGIFREGLGNFPKWTVSLGGSVNTPR